MYIGSGSGSQIALLAPMLGFFLGLLISNPALAKPNQVEMVKGEARQQLIQHLCDYTPAGTYAHRKCLSKKLRIGNRGESLCESAREDSREACLFEEADLSYRWIMLTFKHDGDLEELKVARLLRDKARREAIDKSYIERLRELIRTLKDARTAGDSVRGAGTGT